MTREQWEWVEGHPSIEVSNYGNVRYSKNKKLVPQNVAHGGYLRITICENKKSKNLSVHRLVASAFCKKPQGRNVVNHIDCNRTNNISDNLEWVTTKENCNRSGFNEHVSNALLNSAKVGRRVKQFDLNMNLLSTYKSLSEAARNIGGKVQNICQCCQGKIPTYYKYIWKYE